MYMALISLLCRAGKYLWKGETYKLFKQAQEAKEWKRRRLSYWSDLIFLIWNLGKIPLCISRFLLDSAKETDIFI